MTKNTLEDRRATAAWLDIRTFGIKDECTERISIAIKIRGILSGFVFLLTHLSAAHRRINTLWYTFIFVYYNMEFLAAIIEVAIHKIVRLFFPIEDWEPIEERREKLSDKEKPDRQGHSFEK